MFALQDFQAGLSWREELDLKKALQMSMLEQKRHPEGSGSSDVLASIGSASHVGGGGPFRAPGSNQSTNSSSHTAVNQRGKSATAADM